MQQLGEHPTIVAIRGILDNYDEFGVVQPVDVLLPELAERLHSALGELVHFQDAVGKWGEETFPHMTNDSVIEHLREEIDELEDCTSPGQYCDELADCFILLCQIAHRESIDLLGEARRKLDVNRERSWSAPDERGVSYHVDLPTGNNIFVPLEPIDPWTRLKPLHSDALHTFSRADRANTELLTQALRQADHAEADQAKRKQLFAKVTASVLDVAEEVADAALDIVLDRLFGLDDPDDLAANVAVGLVKQLKTL